MADREDIFIRKGINSIGEHHFILFMFVPTFAEDLLYI